MVRNDQLYGLPVECLPPQLTLRRYSQLEPEQTKQAIGLCCQYADSLESDLTRRKYEIRPASEHTAYC